LSDERNDPPGESVAFVQGAGGAFCSDERNDPPNKSVAFVQGAGGCVL